MIVALGWQAQKHFPPLFLVEMFFALRCEAEGLGSLRLMLDGSRVCFTACASLLRELLQISDMKAIQDHMEKLPAEDLQNLLEHGQWDMFTQDAGDLLFVPMGMFTIEVATTTCTELKIFLVTAADPEDGKMARPMHRWQLQ
jgi:hypothetical protein